MGFNWTLPAIGAGVLAIGATIATGGLASPLLLGAGSLFTGGGAAAAGGAAAGAATAATGATAAAATSAGVLGTGLSGSTIATGVGAAGSLGFGVMGQISQQKVFTEEQQRQNLMALRQKEDTIKQARVAMGTAVNNAATQGAINTSGAAGGQGSIQSSLSGNLGYLTSFNQFSDEASSAGYQASIFGGAEKLGSTIFNNATGENSIFG